MAAAFHFANQAGFSPANAEEILRTVPAARGVFALRGERAADGKEPEPYLTRAADLRRRMRRLLAPPEAVDAEGRPVLSKRLNLRDRVHFIEWTETGSEFESALLMYCAAREAFGHEEARRRLRLHTPYMVRVTRTHTHPRAYVTNRLSRRSLAESFGPFPSRAAAERYCDAVLDLFQLRRCHEDLVVSPEHPGCVYGEMKKCLEPCKAAVNATAYNAEAERVFNFFATHGDSLLAEVAAMREAASEAMDFEQAAALHRQWEKVKAAAALADDLVGPIAELRALIVQEAAPRAESEERDLAAIFLFDHGRIAGTVRLSTLGVRAVREQTAVGSSLFAQPLMLAPIPLEAVAGSPPAAVSALVIPIAPESDGDPPGVPHLASEMRAPSESSLSPEARARAVLDHLEASDATDADIAERCDALSLFRRWYYRPEKQRAGEVFLPNPDGSWPIRRLLNGAARVVLGPPAALPPVDREAARKTGKTVRMKTIHAGREGVERKVPVLDKRRTSGET